MGVCFITAVRHPDSVEDFSRVETLFGLMARTVCGQSDPDLRLVVVCNRIPRLDFEDPRIVYHVVDFPLPRVDTSDGDLPAALYDKRLLDKGTKLLAGLLLARKFDPEYVFFADDDDWINRGLVACLLEQPREPVRYVDAGYLVDFRLRTVKRRAGLLRYCGTTFAFAPDFLLKRVKLDPSVDEHAPKERLLEGDAWFVRRIIGDHQATYRYAIREGVVPSPIPLRAVCWVQNTGQNLTGQGDTEGGLPFSAQFCREFSLPSAWASSSRPGIRVTATEAVGAMRSRGTWFISRTTGRTYF